jgi:hypothetical protein
LQTCQTDRLRRRRRRRREPNDGAHTKRAAAARIKARLLSHPGLAEEQYKDILKGLLLLGRSTVHDIKERIVDVTLGAKNQIKERVGSPLLPALIIQT